MINTSLNIYVVVITEPGVEIITKLVKTNHPTIAMFIGYFGNIKKGIKELIKNECISDDFFNDLQNILKDSAINQERFDNIINGIDLFFEDLSEGNEVDVSAVIWKAPTPIVITQEDFYNKAKTMLAVEYMAKSI